MPVSSADVSERRVIAIDDGGPSLVVDVYDASEPRGAVFCVHGFGSSRRSVKNEHLAAVLPPLGWTVIALDLQGHGDSAGDFEGLTVGRSIDDVRRVAALPEYADAPRRALVGSSFGGLVAAWAAAEDQALCDALLLIAPAFGYLDRYLPTLSAEERNAWESGSLHRVQLDTREVLLGSGVLDERAARPLDQLATSLRVRTVIVHGTADEAVPFEASEDFAQRSRRDDLELVLLTGADHRLAEHLPILSRHARLLLDAIPAERPPGSN